MGLLGALGEELGGNWAYWEHWEGSWVRSRGEPGLLGELGGNWAYWEGSWMGSRGELGLQGELEGTGLTGGTGRGTGFTGKGNGGVRSWELLGKAGKS